METVITWKLCTSLRGAECDLLSDGGESELIGGRCWCVRLIYTCARGCICALRDESCIIQPHVKNRTRRLHLHPDLTTSGALVMYCHQPQHGTRFLQSLQQYTDLVFTLLLHSFLLCIVLFLFYISCYFCLHTCSHHCFCTPVWLLHTGTGLTCERWKIVIHCYPLSYSPVMTAQHYYSQFTNYPSDLSSDPHSQQHTGRFVLRSD